MTREDAINIMKVIVHMLEPQYDTDRIEDAVEMSIKALEQEQKTGHWIAYEVQLPDRTILNYRCSVCKRKLIGYNTETLSEAPFCHCGAKMEGVQE